QVGSRELSDLYLLAAGGLSPLHGFMAEDDYRAVLGEGRLAGGQPFTIPVLLRTDQAGADLARAGERIALWSGGEPVGLVTVSGAGGRWWASRPATRSTAPTSI